MAKKKKKKNKKKKNKKPAVPRSAMTEFMLLHKHGGEMTDKRSRKPKEKKKSWKNEDWS